MARNLVADFAAGTITNNPLAIGGTSITSSRFAELPAVASPDILWIVLDRYGMYGAPEIVAITAHTASSITATVLRAQQGTVARSHVAGTTWDSIPTGQYLFQRHLRTADTTSLAAITGQAEGDTCYVISDGLERIWNGSVWKIHTPQRGSASLVWPGATNVSNTLTITFPVAYSASPNVAISSVAYTTNTPYVLQVTAIGSSSVTVRGWRMDGTNFSASNTTVWWVAQEASV
jgi:hypothetical protein